MRAFFLALGLLATPAMAADQFDLICTARVNSQSEHYRIDLARGEWCARECKKVDKIQSITSNMIVLYDEKPQLPDLLEQYNRINRTTGEWEVHAYSPRVLPFGNGKVGKCEPVEFSGFPQVKF